MKKTLLIIFALISIGAFSQTYSAKTVVSGLKMNPGVHTANIDLLPAPTSGAHTDWHWTITIGYTGHVSLSAGSYAKMQECGTADGNTWNDYAMDSVIMTHTAATISFAEKFSTSSRSLRLYIKIAANDTATVSVYYTLIAK